MRSSSSRTPDQGIRVEPELARTIDGYSATFQIGMGIFAEMG